MVSEQLPLQRLEGGASGPNVIKDLQVYLTTFESSLKVHIESVTRLKQALTSEDTPNFNKQEQDYRQDKNTYPPVPTPFGVVSMPVSTYYRGRAAPTNAAQSASSPSGIELLPLLRPSRAQMQVDIDLEMHMRELKRFLDEHIASVEALKKNLDLSSASQFPHGQEAGSVGPLEAHENTVKADHSSRYSTIVLMSTFTASLIVAFLQLMKDFLPPLTEISTATYTFHYHLGFSFGFVGLVWNICVAIVAGANTVVEASASARVGLGNNVVNEEPESTRTAANEQAQLNNVVLTAPIGSHSTHTAFAQAKKRLTRRSIAFAVAQFLGFGIFGVCIGVLYYPVHSGHILWLVPAILLPIAFGLAAHDLTKSVNRATI